MISPQVITLFRETDNDFKLCKTKTTDNRLKVITFRRSLQENTNIAGSSQQEQLVKDAVQRLGK